MLIPLASVTVSASFSSNWTTWSQGGFGLTYKSTLNDGSYAFTKYGCHFIAQCKLMAEAGLTVNPDTYCKWIVDNNISNKYIFGYQSNGTLAIGEKSIGKTMIDYAALFGYTIKREGSVSLSGKTAAEKKTAVQNLINSGYYVILDCSAHETYIMKAKSTSTNTPWISDSSSNYNSVSTSSGIYAYTGSTGGGGWEVNFTTAYYYSVKSSDLTAPIVTAPSQYYNKGDSITFTWNEVPGATSYWVWVGHSNGAELVSGSVGNVTSYTGSFDTIGTHRICVTAINSYGQATSAPFYFDVYDPVPLAPTLSVLNSGGTSTFKEGDEIILSWNAVDYAVSYSYYLSEFPEGFAYSNFVRSGNTADTSIKFSDLSSGHYTLFVEPVNSSYVHGAQSNWVSFDVLKSDYIPSKVSIETTGNENKLYAVYDGAESWTFAKFLCESLGGHLATVTSVQENSIVHDLIEDTVGDGYWLGGLNAPNNDSEYDSQSWPYTWITGEEFNYSAWYSGEPSGTPNGGKTEHFLEVRKSYGNNWNDLANRSSANDGFILEIDNIDQITPVNTVTYNGSEYRLYDVTMGWSLAEAFCEYQGGHLAIVDSRDEFDQLSEVMSNGTRLWYYLGGQYEGTADNANWIDGAPINRDIMNWSDYNSGSRLFIYKENDTLGWMGDLYVYPVHQSYVGFICEIDHVHIYTDTVTAPTCSEQGYTTHVCSCGDSYVDTYTAALGHDFGEWVVTKEATLTEEGIETRTCTREGCGATETRAIPKLDPQQEPDPDAPKLVISKIEKATPGKTVTVNVSVENNPGFSSFIATVNYDTSRLTLDSVALAEGIGGQFNVARNVAWINSSDFTDDGVFMTLTFTVKDDAVEGDAFITVSYEEGDISNHDEDDVNFAVVDGNVAVSPYTPGDINGDDKVNSKDLTRLLKYLSGENVTVNEAALDVNGDGKVNSKDLTRLLKYLSGENVEIF